MARVDTAREQLAGLVGLEHVLAGDAAAAYPVDGLTPSFAVSPGTPDEVASMLALANQQGLGVIPWGGGTGQGWGNLPRCYDLALSLRRLDRVLDHQPADLTVTVEAGITLDGLQAQLREHGQFLPLDPPCADQATIGGILACAAAGPQRYRYGAPRDLLLGIRVANPDGTLTRAGGKVVKNVAGYDLNRLYTGSLGTLGVIVEATFKVLPAPPAYGVAMGVFPTVETALAFSEALLNSPVRPLACELFNAEALLTLSNQAGIAASSNGYGVFAAFGGVEAAVQRQLSDFDTLAKGHRSVHIYVSTELATSLNRSLSDLGWTATTPAPLVLRASGLPGVVPDLFNEWEVAGQRFGVTPLLRAHAGNGIVEGFFWSASGAELPPDIAIALIRELIQHAASLGTSLVVTACSPEVKAEIDVWGPAPGSFPLMQRIKAEFDPNGTLNPGRFMGRL